MHQFSPAKKSLGQNFLNNIAVVQKIIEASQLTGKETVLEIGPGRGVLTELLIENTQHVVAIEKDDDLFKFLNTEFKNDIDTGKATFIHGDIMEINQAELVGLDPYSVIANIPYNITGAILEKFLSGTHQPSQMVLMVQKEVAERITTKTKNPKSALKESILSISVKAYGIPEYISTVKAGNFTPAPKVDSAIVRIHSISRNNFIDKYHEQIFFELVKAGFAHKRKQLYGNLKNILEPELVSAALNHVGISYNRRSESLTVNLWVELSKFVYNKQYGK